MTDPYKLGPPKSWAAEGVDQWAEERKALTERAEKVEAEAAGIKRVLSRNHQFVCDKICPTVWFAQRRPHHPVCGEMVAILSGTAGRALLAEVKALRKIKEAARNYIYGMCKIEDRMALRDALEDHAIRVGEEIRRG